MLNEWLLFLHIASAVVYVGGIITIGVQAIRAGSAPKQFLEFSGIAGRAIGAGAVLLLLTGIALVVESSFWGFTMAFIVFGIAALVFAGAVDSLYFRKRTKAIEAAIEEEGPESPKATAGIIQLAWVNLAMIVLFLAVIWAMVFKPGL